MTVTTNEYGQNNLFAKEPQMVVEEYNRKGLESPQQYVETYNGRWAMMVSSLDSSPTLPLQFFSVSSDDRSNLTATSVAFLSSELFCTTTTETY